VNRVRVNNFIKNEKGKTRKRRKNWQIEEKQYICECLPRRNEKDRRNYQDRDATILKKQNVERNYNARPYVFQIEYSVNGKKHIYRNINLSFLH
jgi:hypothetical protein